MKIIIPKSKWEDYIYEPKLTYQETQTSILCSDLEQLNRILEVENKLLMLGLGDDSGNIILDGSKDYYMFLYHMSYEFEEEIKDLLFYECLSQIEKRDDETEDNNTLILQSIPEKLIQINSKCKILNLEYVMSTGEKTRVNLTIELPNE